MGHTEQTIDAAYREQIDDARLVAVAEYVHHWLFGIGRKRSKIRLCREGVPTGAQAAGRVPVGNLIAYSIRPGRPGGKD